jgi:hypothetical protein
VLLASAASVAAPPDSGDPAAGRPQGLATAAWKLEAVELADGRRLEGLIVEEDDDGVVFVQVVRRPGKPMFLVSRGRIDGRRIRATSRLPAADHAMLASRVEAFRGQRDAARISELAVSLTQDDETGPWRYAGRWFSLDSTMPAASTREAVVRLEQVLEALATLVPAATSRPAAAPPIAVRLCGTQSEYRREQERLGIRIDNPAFYVPSRRLLVAGSDMPAIVEQEQLAADALSLTERSLAAVLGSRSRARGTSGSEAGRPDRPGSLALGTRKDRETGRGDGRTARQRRRGGRRASQLFRLARP